MRIVNKVAKIAAERPVRGYRSKTDEKYLVLSRGDISGGGKKWSNSIHILEVQQTRFTEQLHAESERKRRVQNDVKVLGLSN